MKTNHHQYIWIVVLALFTSIAGCAAEDLYRFLYAIPIGGETNAAGMCIDQTTHRLYVAHGTGIGVVDLAANPRFMGEITNSSVIQGMTLVPRMRHGFVSLGSESAVGCVDLHALKADRKFKAGKNPGPIITQQAGTILYVFDQNDQTAGVYESDDGDYVGMIKLSGRPVCVAADSKSGQVYYGVADTNEILVIDPRTRQAVHHWPVAPGERVSAIAVDEAHRRLLVGCGNKLMVMMDSTTGKVLATLPVSGAIDAIAFDPATQLAFGASSEGIVAIVHEDMPDKLTVVQTLTTEPGARTMALDPATHKIYLASASFESLPKNVSDAPAQQIKMVSDGLKILVYGTDKAANPSR